MLDQLAADAGAAAVLGDEQVLQVTVVVGRPAGAVVDEMHQAHSPAVAPGQCGMHRFVRVEKTLPGGGAGRLVELGLVEAQVALPERQPGGVIDLADGANTHCVHRRVPRFIWVATACSLASSLRARWSRAPSWSAAVRFWLSFHLPSRRSMGRAKPTIARSMLSI
ncbi:hypothetical protein D9M68_848220 [compost metagenome]